MGREEEGRRRRGVRAALIRSQAEALLASGAIFPGRKVVVPPQMQRRSIQQVAHRVVHQDTHRACLGVGGVSGVLVFGSARRAGGGWETGAKAQEEDVSLASTWAVQAERVEGFYGQDNPMGPDAVIMARGYWLIDENGAHLATPREVVFAGVSAPNLTRAELGAVGQETLVDCLARRLAVAILQWKQEGVDALVLGAIGCGVFQWPVEQSAKALRRALSSSGWTGEVVVAIPDPRVAEVFSATLGQVAAFGRRGPG